MIEENQGYFAVDELLKQVNDDHRRIDALVERIRLLEREVSVLLRVNDLYSPYPDELERAKALGFSVSTE
jgi:cell division protein FtsB